jgi:CRISPR-associated protein Csx3
VVISGRAPIWLYSYLCHVCHPTPWIACYDPRLGAVVTVTHVRCVRVGDIIPLTDLHPNHGNAALCPALLVVGPPDSGKSVLSYTLFHELQRLGVDVYLQRAHWDGESNYLLELGEEVSPTWIEEVKRLNRGQLTKRFYPFQANAILNLRRQKSLVIVDVGGMVQEEKMPVLEACSHYLIISSCPEAVEPWHCFCRDRGNLQPIAVLHSVLETCFEVRQLVPYLEAVSGEWSFRRRPIVPEVLFDRIRQLLPKQRNGSS